MGKTNQKKRKSTAKLTNSKSSRLNFFGLAKTTKPRRKNTVIKIKKPKTPTITEKLKVLGYTGQSQSGFMFPDFTQTTIPKTNFSGQRLRQHLIQLSHIILYWLKNEAKNGNTTDPVEVQIGFDMKNNSMIIATNNNDSANYFYNHITGTNTFFDFLNCNKPGNAPETAKQIKNIFKRKTTKFFTRIINPAVKGELSDINEKVDDQFYNFMFELRCEVIAIEKLPDDINNYKENTLYISTNKSLINPNKKFSNKDNRYVHAERDIIELIKKLDKGQSHFVIEGVKIPCVTCAAELDQAGLLPKDALVSKLFVNQIPKNTQDNEKSLDSFLAGCQEIIAKQNKCDIHYNSAGSGYQSDSEAEEDDDDMDTN